MSASASQPDDALPPWLATLAGQAREAVHDPLGRFAPPPLGGRDAAVLVLFGDGDGDGDRSGGPDVLLMQRAARMRRHPGQPAFPGGAVDDTDADPAATALREAQEETGLDPAGVEVFAVLPELWLPPSNFVVTPVLAWWREPSPVHAAMPAEVESVHRVPVAELTDPANRVLVRHPSGYIGPAFTVQGLLVWGFTAGLLDRILTLGGWDRPWDRTRVVPLPDPVDPEPESGP